MIDLNIDLQAVTDWLSLNLSVWDLDLPDLSEPPAPEPEAEGKTPGGGTVDEAGK